MADRLERLEDMIEKLMPLVGLVQDLGSNVSAIRGEEAQLKPGSGLPNGADGGRSQQGYKIAGNMQKDMAEPHGSRANIENIPRGAVMQSLKMQTGSPLSGSGQWTSGATIPSIGQSGGSKKRPFPSYHAEYNGKFVCEI